MSALPLRASTETKTIVVHGNSAERAVRFLALYQSLPNDADIEIHLGVAESDGVKTPVVVVHLSGEDHVFSVSEARKVAAVAENTLNKFPGWPEVDGLPNLVLSLRHGADKAEAPTC